MITFAYFTSRQEPHILWFLDSLHRELKGEYQGVRVVIVDFWQRDRLDWFIKEPLAAHARGIALGGGMLIHEPPKPTVWQGMHRLTKDHWWAASNARNTAICLAPDGWIVFVDDLSVLKPGYMARVHEAMDRPDTITCGAYRKVRNLVVEDGKIMGFEDHPGGHDNRYAAGKDNEAIPCGGNWMYGCSLVAPVEAFLSIGGFPEAWCDGMSYEDCIAGIMLEKKGWKLRYDRSLMTFESEEGHHHGPVMRREDPGVSPNDKSHFVLAAAQRGDGQHPNYFAAEGIRGLRQRVLAGEMFPIMKIPEHEFFTGKRLSEL